jgi:hypothetical protein
LLEIVEIQQAKEEIVRNLRLQPGDEATKAIGGR